MPASLTTSNLDLLRRDGETAGRREPLRGGSRRPGSRRSGKEPRSNHPYSSGPRIQLLRRGDKDHAPRRGGSGAEVGTDKRNGKIRARRDGPEPGEKPLRQGVTGCTAPNQSDQRGCLPAPIAGRPSRGLEEEEEEQGCPVEPQTHGNFVRGTTSPGRSCAAITQALYRDRSLFPSRPRDLSGFVEFLQQTTLFIMARREVSQGSREGI